MDVVELLIAAAGADVNIARTSDFVTPLFIAAYEGNVRVVQRLIAAPGKAAQIKPCCSPSAFSASNRPIPVYRSPRRALTLCPQLCMVIQPGARFPARSADAVPESLYGRFT